MVLSFLTKYIGFSVYTYIGDDMRIFYIFKIKAELIPMYKNSPKDLFNTLKHIYSLNNNTSLGLNLFNQLCLPIAKDKLDLDI